MRLTVTTRSVMEEIRNENKRAKFTAKFLSRLGKETGVFASADN